MAQVCLPLAQVARKLDGAELRNFRSNQFLDATFHSCSVGLILAITQNMESEEIGPFYPFDNPELEVKAMCLKLALD